MSRLAVHTSACLLFLSLAVAGTAAAQTCVRIDESVDVLQPPERAAAVRLVRKELTQAGHRFDSSDCQATYTLSHLRLGRTIIVTLSGPEGSREGTALGLDDLPAIYSQLVRSLITGVPMGSMGVLDRTNVSETQSQTPRRVQSEGTWYARVGYGGLFGPTTDPVSSFGLGFRAEFDRFGLDLSFFNLDVSTDSSSYYGARGSSMSIVRLEGLRFMNPTANHSAYFGGGVSFGSTDLRRQLSGDAYPTSGRGSGLRGELTVGYELARVTSARVFAQADVTLPFYQVAFNTYAYPADPRSGGAPTVTTERKYVPSVTVSVGLGWQRGRR
jgi:hypothetical protein